MSCPAHAAAPSASCRVTPENVNCSACRVCFLQTGSLGSSSLVGLPARHNGQAIATVRRCSTAVAAGSGLKGTPAQLRRVLRNARSSRAARPDAHRAGRREVADQRFCRNIKSPVYQRRDGQRAACRHDLVCPEQKCRTPMRTGSR